MDFEGEILIKKKDFASYEYTNMTLRLANFILFNLLNLPPIYKPKTKGEMQLFCKKKKKETTIFFLYDHKKYIFFS